MITQQRTILGVCIGIWPACHASAQETPVATVSLTVPSGTPLPLYLTEQFPNKIGTLISARLIDPICVFDKEVIPAGSEVEGTVVSAVAVGKMQRFRSITRGDFTPLKVPMVEFTELRLEDGRSIPIHTRETPGLNSIYIEPRKPHPGSPKQDGDNAPMGSGALGGRNGFKAEVAGPIQSLNDTVHGPKKKERLMDFATAKLPYHTQYLHKGTRFDAELRDDLSFGSEAFVRGTMPALGTQPPPDAVVSARLLAALDSGTAKPGDPVDAVLTQPLFNANRQLVLPEGTRLKGAVVMAQHGTWFHRTGQLRFNFRDIELPDRAVQLGAMSSAEMPTEAVLQAGEPGGHARLKIDSEGGVKASEPKTRFISPIFSVWGASGVYDNVAFHLARGVVKSLPIDHAGGSTGGGAPRFGMASTVVSQTSSLTGIGFGYYGLAWSVYSNLISRGAEVHFERNAILQIRFGGRAPVRAGADEFPSTTPTPPLNRQIARKRRRLPPPIYTTVAVNYWITPHTEVGR